MARWARQLSLLLLVSWLVCARASPPKGAAQVEQTRLEEERPVQRPEEPLEQIRQQEQEPQQQQQQQQQQQEELPGRREEEPLAQVQVQAERKGGPKLAAREPAKLEQVDIQRAEQPAEAQQARKPWQQQQQQQQEEEPEAPARELQAQQQQVQAQEEPVRAGEQAAKGEAEPYAFQYSSENSARSESGDSRGRVRGHYSLQAADGSSRFVDYVADHNGFRAAVSTNEHGTESRSPASVNLRSSQPSAEELSLRAEARAPELASLGARKGGAAQRHQEPPAPAPVPAPAKGGSAPQQEKRPEEAPARAGKTSRVESQPGPIKGPKWAEKWVEKGADNKWNEKGNDRWQEKEADKWNDRATDKWTEKGAEKSAERWTEKGAEKGPDRWPPAVRTFSSDAPLLAQLLPAVQFAPVAYQPAFTGYTGYRGYSGAQYAPAYAQYRPGLGPLPAVPSVPALVSTRTRLVPAVRERVYPVSSSFQLGADYRRSHQTEPATKGASHSPSQLEADHLSSFEN